MTDARACLCAVGLALAAPFGALAAGPTASTVHIDEMTWTELHDRIGRGTTIVLVPIGGTEQNGPHMVLGKHNVRVRVLAQRIAERLGNAVVAPVLAYVPEGAIDPPTQHMRYPGTISIPEPVFEATLDAAARGFRQHGLRDIVLLGDHGGYRASLDRVAARLNREWTGYPAVRVHALGEYYRAASADYAAALKAQGFSAGEIGGHAGLADTSLALAADRSLVRQDLLAKEPRRGSPDGVIGDPRRSSVELGQPGLDHIVDVSVAAIRQRTQRTAD
jgi:creatinine amidohydrolase